ncbi:hypothetical protein COO91_06416 [Nostoc flagelliforme CCNUN1]|uniref:Uncharacterized protein n=1 Tax=Nostoc flagelliforme CCNUN1 TaxID=2038116 RepID=A0A2K8SYH8_9NOSO|nr:hypothetical protein COO91_06416 [Nostoc flagelliforme CCNUN1]
MKKPLLNTQVTNYHFSTLKHILPRQDQLIYQLVPRTL